MMSISVELITRKLGQSIGLLNPVTQAGCLLDVQLKINQLGGLSTFSFDVPVDTTLPIVVDSLCKFRQGVQFIGVGVITEVKPGDLAFVTVSGTGLWSKLNSFTFSYENLTNTLPVASLITLLFTQGYMASADILGVDTSALAAYTPVAISFNKKTVGQAITTLLDMLNVAYLTAEYTCQVTEDRVLKFSLRNQAVANNLFEGFHYQEPTVILNAGSIVNEVTFFRSTLADKNKQEQVAVYSDTLSIIKYGLKAKKVSFADYVDAATCARIANYILGKFAKPIPTATLKDVSADLDLTFSKFNISTKPIKRNQVISDSESLTDFSAAASSGVTFSLVGAGEAFTGRSSVQCVVGAAPSGYIEYAAPIVINKPSSLSLYVYLQAGVSFRLALGSSSADLYSATLQGTSTGWHRLTVDIINKIIQVALMRNGPSDNAIHTSDSFVLFGQTTDTTYVSDIKIVRIYWITPSTTILLDRIEAMSVDWQTYNLLHQNLTLKQLDTHLDVTMELGATNAGLVDVLVDMASKATSNSDIFLKE